MRVDSQELRQLLDRGETFTVEFKSDQGDDPVNDTAVVEAVACLANGDGGILLIGVCDDGTPHGAPAPTWPPYPPCSHPGAHSQPN